jgi:hypothetical protein
MKEYFLSLPASRFSSSLPIIILTRPEGSSQDWQEFDRGPGYFDIPADFEVRIRLKSINDEDLLTLVRELEEVEGLRFLDLAENRNVTNTGLGRLKSLPQLVGLNLSSCTINNTGLESLKPLRQLAYLDLSYCSRLQDNALKTLDAMRNLTYVNLLGCLHISKGGLARVRRRNLEIHI